jgi:hypothetical protein
MTTRVWPITRVVLVGNHTFLISVFWLGRWIGSTRTYRVIVSLVFRLIRYVFALLNVGGRGRVCSKECWWEGEGLFERVLQLFRQCCNCCSKKCCKLFWKVVISCTPQLNLVNIRSRQCPTCTNTLTRLRNRIAKTMFGHAGPSGTSGPRCIQFPAPCPQVCVFVWLAMSPGVLLCGSPCPQVCFVVWLATSPGVFCCVARHVPRCALLSGSPRPQV